jgi:hypothetical protein
LGKILKNLRKLGNFFWRQIRVFGTTFVLDTLTKGQWISNENWNSDLRLEFERNLVKFLGI